VSSGGDDGATTHRVEPGDPAATGLGGPSLLVLSPEGLSLHRLPAEGSLVIGRGDEADVCLRDPSVSRAHARLAMGPPLAISDLESANGVLVRGKRVGQDAPFVIAPGEPIALGKITIVVQSGPPPRGRGWIASATGPAVFVPAPREDERLTPIVAEAPPMKDTVALVDRVAQSHITVLLLGETGAGKEVLARRLHEASGRKGPLLEINCATLSPALLESELFGHERGAFTGAVAQKPGLLESARGGTVLLDEVGELAPSLQAKLLRALEQREVLRVGGRTPVAIDVRFVAATNRDLRAEVERGAFRADLYYRLNGIAIEIPPLRDRPEDLEPLAHTFLAPSGTPIAPDALAALRAHTFPGNVRELRQAIERAVVLAGDDGAITRAHLPPEIGSASARDRAAPETAPEDERERILWALERCAHNQTRAAELLGISRRTLVTRIKEHKIPRPRKGYP
jgi:transcriptional regulator with AAA-type ATPase domain